MIQKIKTLSKAELIRFFSDTRNIGLVVFGIVSLLVTWSGVKVVQTNYDLQKQISAMRQANQIKKLENSNLALKTQYLQTDQYLELSARRQYNKALPGEKLLIVPESVALAHSVDIPVAESDSKDKGTDPVEAGPWYERNFNAWLDFMFRNRQG